MILVFRCSDVTEFGSNLSTIYDDGHVMLPESPLNTEAEWVCDKTGVRRQAEEVKEQLVKIGVELEVSSLASLNVRSNVVIVGAGHEGQC